MKNLIAVAALVVSLAACSAATDQTGTTSATANADDQRQKSAECLRSKGVEVGDPSGRREGQTLNLGELDREEFEKAVKECGLSGGLGNGQEMSQADKDKALAFAKCMREQGIDFPDPDFESGQGAARAMPGDPAAFEKANKICAEKTE